jgi:hypothetical protein
MILSNRVVAFSSSRFVWNYDDLSEILPSGGARAAFDGSA